MHEGLTGSVACTVLAIGVAAGTGAPTYGQPPTAITGGAGSDRISGGAGRDSISAGAGNDRVSARDNTRDSVDCGSGRKDRVTADTNDSVKSDCEVVSRR